MGWGRVPRLVLKGEDGQVVNLQDALVLALHDAAETDEAPFGDEDFDLEFAVDGERLQVPLQRFLAVWLTRLPAAQEVVLALCNSDVRPVTRPAGLVDGARLWHAEGDVDSWAEDNGGLITWGLLACRWKVV